LTTYGVVLFCSIEPNFYNEEHKQLLTTFCSQAIITLQNAQLFEDLQHEQQKILEKEAEARRSGHDLIILTIAAIAIGSTLSKWCCKKRMWLKHEEVIKLKKLRNAPQRTGYLFMRPVILLGVVAGSWQYADRLIRPRSFKVGVNNRSYNGQLSSEAEG
jgi:hypothetical protein